MTKRKRIIIDVTEEFHQEVKRRALKQKISIKEYVENAIIIYNCESDMHEPLPEYKYGK